MGGRKTATRASPPSPRRSLFPSYPSTFSMRGRFPPSSFSAAGINVLIGNRLLSLITLSRTPSLLSPIVPRFFFPPRGKKTPLKSVQTPTGLFLQKCSVLPPLLSFFLSDPQWYPGGGFKLLFTFIATPPLQRQLFVFVPIGRQSFSSLNDQVSFHSPPFFMGHLPPALCSPHPGQLFGHATGCPHRTGEFSIFLGSATRLWFLPIDSGKICKQFAELYFFKDPFPHFP